MKLKLIPYPKSIEIQNNAECKGISCIARNDFDDPRIPPNIDLLIESSGRKLVICKDENLDGNDEYIIELDKDFITIKAKYNAAVFRALTTLKQLKRNKQLFSAAKIHDWADIEMRIQQVDLKRVGWNLTYLLELIERFADMKINYILLEYEDKFKFDFCDNIPVESAFTKGQIAELEKTAYNNFIQIIPLVQCLGHYEYILKHDKYAEICENPDIRSQACPLHPKTLELFKQMSNEVIEAHPSSEFFHIGGDEPFLLGTCPKCKAETKTSGKGTLYANYLNKVISWMNSKGKRPIVWADIILSHDDAAKVCSKDVMVADWNYRTNVFREPVIRFYQRPDKSLDSKLFLTEISEEQHKKFDKYLEYDSQTKLFNSLPYGPYLKDLGFDVISAGNVITVENVITHSEAVVSKSLKGVMATYWAAANSIRHPYTAFETRMSGICMLAMSSWNFNHVYDNRKSFFKEIGEYFTGTKKAAAIYETFNAETTLTVPNSSQAYLKNCFKEALSIKQNIRRESLPGTSLIINFIEKNKVEKDFFDFKKSKFTKRLLKDSCYKIIDLAPYCNENFVNSKKMPGWTRIYQNDLRFFPRGEVCFDGVPFYVNNSNKSVVMVGNNENLPWHPDKIENIKIDTAADYICFVHGAIEGKPLPNGHYGRYIIHYSDGNTEDIPLCYLKNISEWWRIEEIEDAAIAWAGKNLKDTKVGLHIFTYSTGYPDKKIESIDFVCEAQASLALAAITTFHSQNELNKNIREIMFRLNKFNTEFMKLEAEMKKKLAKFLSPDGVDEICRISFDPTKKYINRQLKIISNNQKVKQ